MSGRAPADWVRGGGGVDEVAARKTGSVGASADQLPRVAVVPTAAEPGPNRRPGSTDVIDELAGIEPGSVVDTLRRHRTQAREQSQASYDALFTEGSTSGFGLADRLAVATFVAGLHADASGLAHYAGRLAEVAGADQVSLITGLAEAAATSGPYGRYPATVEFEEDVPGPVLRLEADTVAALGRGLAAALEHAHLLVFRPREASPDALDALTAVGWSTAEIVTLSQLVAFLSFQLRVASGLRAVAGEDAVAGNPVVAGSAPVIAGSTRDPRATPSTPIGGAVVTSPPRFTRENLGWQPWLEPVAADALTDVQRDALIDAGRAKSEYFRLLAHDPAILKARTLTDNDIFYNPDAGLPRGEREFAAAATSRYNGCLFCASVHARFAAHFLPDVADVDALLADGVGAGLTPRARTITNAVVALTSTPSRFGTAEVDALRAAGLDDQAIADLVHASAFFNWANRLMLSLGEPSVPAP